MCLRVNRCLKMLVDGFVRQVQASGESVSTVCLPVGSASIDFKMPVKLHLPFLLLLLLLQPAPPADLCVLASLSRRIP